MVGLQVYGYAGYVIVQTVNYFGLNVNGIGIKRSGIVEGGR